MEPKHKFKTIFLIIAFGLLFLSSCTSFGYKEELIRTYYNLGNAYSDLGDYKQSSAAFVRALEIDPSFPSAAYNLGIVHIQSGNYSEGIDVLRNLLQKEPDNIILMKVLAWGYYKNGELFKSIEIYEKIIQIDFSNTDALKNITILMMNLQMYERAYPYLVQLETIGDVESIIYYNIGVSERELGISSGLKWFNLAYEKDKNMEKNLYALIDALLIEKDFKRIVELYNSLIAINSDPELVFNKAFILLTEIEDYELGIPALETALKNGYNNPERIEELKSFNDLLDRDKILSVFINNPPLDNFETNDEEEIILIDDPVNLN